MTEGFPKLFTEAEANELLPALRQDVEQILAARREILRLRPELAPVLEKAGSNGGSNYAGPVLAAFERVQAAVRRIQAHGVVVKDVNSGLLDFPSERGGRVVFLCWKHDEPTVGHWHDVDAGFAGRNPL
jgi:hypothetical protein